MARTADIVVVGAGVIGASIAYHLAARRARVLVLERGTIGSGETHKSGGFVQTHWDDVREVRLIARSRDIFASWADRIGGDCGYVRGGYLHVTGPQREADVRQVHAMVVAEGLESHWLDRHELVKLQPLINVADLAGGAWEPASGWADPLATTGSLVAAARREGAELREGVGVVAIAHAGGRIIGVETTAGSIACGTVILAAGPWTPRLHLGEPLPIQLERGQVCYFACPNGPAHGFYDEVTGIYTHPDGDTHLVGKDWPFDHIADPDDYKRDVDTKYIVKTAFSLGHRFPALGESLIRRGVTGLYDFTPDGQPIVDGPLGLTGYYVAVGFSGAGFKSAPATGLGMAELVLDGSAASVSIDHLRLERFRRPPTPVEATPP